MTGKEHFMTDIACDKALPVVIIKALVAVLDWSPLVTTAFVN